MSTMADSFPHGLSECVLMLDAHHVSLCYSPHALSACVLMPAIMSPYAILHMVCMAFSSWLKSCLHHMLFSTLFAWHSPHAGEHVSICYSPHGLHCIFLMLFSTWFAWHSPHAGHHVSICMLFSSWFALHSPYG